MKYMISKHKIYFKDGSYKTNVRVVEGYRPGPGMSPKQRQIKNFGYLEDAKDPKKFWDEVNAEEEKLKLSKETINIEFEQNSSLKESKVYCLGYKYIESIYDFLELDNFFKKLNTKYVIDFKNIIKFIIIERVLNPDSKRATFLAKDMLYNFSDKFDYHQIIRVLDILDKYNEEIQDYLHKVIEKKIGRESEYMFYDTTNFYFEKDYATEGKLPQRGVSKEHKTEPIVQFGLFMDSNKLPVRMMCFSGNTSDSLTYLPMIKQLKKKNNYERIITVADKGINSNDNLSYIFFNGDGYVFSQILKGKKGNRYHTKMFEDSEFIYNKDKTYKFRVFEEDFEYVKKDNNGKVIEKKEAKRKVLIYWKKSIADREAKKREIKLKQAKKYANNNAYGLQHDATKYVKITYLDSDTGAVSDMMISGVDIEKAKKDAKYDGYFCIVTSEIDYDNNKIHEVYSQLEKIEETFRICKTNLEVRPIYVHTDEHIKAHLLICFISLLIIRLLELKIKNSNISIERIQRALNSFNCEEISKGIFHLTLSKRILKELKNEKDNEIYIDLMEIQKSFGEQFDYVNVKQEKLNQYLKKIKFAITK